MQLDKSIVQLAAKLDAWFGGNLATFASQDPVAQGKALLDGVQLAKEFDRLKAKGAGRNSSAAHTAGFDHERRTRRIACLRF